MADKNVLIFAGAGASKAISKEHFPTTIEFFERLPDSIKSNPLFSAAASFCKQKNKEKIIDIEDILWELQILNQFCDQYKDNSNFLGYVFENDRLIQLTGQRGWNLGHLSSVTSNISSACADLVGSINSFVYDYYSHEPTFKELDKNWLYLISKMFEIRVEPDIFTTNYDVAIETSYLRSKIENIDDFFGIEGVTKKKLNLEKWNRASHRDRRLTKLHGSIDWHYGGKDIFIGSPIYTGNHSNHAIIYPGFKGERSDELFITMHSYLSRRLNEADYCIFIGFAFRDEYINRLVSQRIRRDCTIFSINPDKSISVPTTPCGISKINAYFDDKSIDNVISQIQAV